MLDAFTRQARAQLELAADCAECCRLEGWLTVENGFLFPTLAALRWQDSKMTEPEAAALHRKLLATARRH